MKVMLTVKGQEDWVEDSNITFQDGKIMTEGKQRGGKEILYGVFKPLIP
jgi:hypothetical protein